MLARIEGGCARRDGVQPRDTRRLERGDAARGRGDGKPGEHAPRRAGDEVHHESQDAGRDGAAGPTEDERRDQRCHRRGAQHAHDGVIAHRAGEVDAQHDAERRDEPGRVPVAGRPVQPSAPEGGVDGEAVGQQPWPERQDADHRASDGERDRERPRTRLRASHRDEQRRERRVEEQTAVFEDGPGRRVRPGAREQGPRREQRQSQDGDRGGAWLPGERARIERHTDEQRRERRQGRDPDRVREEAAVAETEPDDHRRWCQDQQARPEQLATARRGRGRGGAGSCGHEVAGRARRDCPPLWLGHAHVRADATDSLGYIPPPRNMYEIVRSRIFASVQKFQLAT